MYTHDMYNMCVLDEGTTSKFSVPLNKGILIVQTKNGTDRALCSRDVDEMYDKILNDRLRFPYYVSGAARELLIGLLEVKGCTRPLVAWPCR